METFWKDMLAGPSAGDACRGGGGAAAGGLALANTLPDAGAARCRDGTLPERSWRGRSGRISMGSDECDALRGGGAALLVAKSETGVGVTGDCGPGVLVASVPASPVHSGVPRTAGRIHLCGRVCGSGTGGRDCDRAALVRTFRRLARLRRGLLRKEATQLRAARSADGPCSECRRRAL